jgi:hypothetical protein
VQAITVNCDDDDDDDDDRDTAAAANIEVAGKTGRINLV